MNCPKCQTGLEPCPAGSGPACQCSGCHGIWIDREALKAHMPRESHSPALVHPAQSTDWPCTNCPGRTLEARFYDSIEIDYCRSCGGIFLDAGELEKIIERHAPGDPKRASGSDWSVAGEIVLELFGDIAFHMLDWS